MKVLKGFFLILLGMIIGLGGLAGGLYLTYSSSKVKTVTDTIGLNGDDIIGSVGKEMIIKDYISAVTDTKKTVGEYEELLPVLTKLIDEVLETGGLSQFVSVNKENLRATRLCDLSESLVVGGDILTLSASMESLGVNLGEMKGYSIFDDTYYKTSVMENIFNEYYSSTDYGYSSSKPLFAFDSSLKTLTRVANFDENATDVHYYQLSGKCSSGSNQIKYGYKASENKYYVIEDLYNSLNSLAIDSVLPYNYDGYFVVNTLVDVNYDKVITQSELDLISYVDGNYNDYELFYRTHFDALLTFCNDTKSFILNEDNSITCQMPNKVYFVYREGMYYQPIFDVMEIMGTRFNELYLFEIVSGIENTELASFANLSLQDFTNGEMTKTLGDTELLAFLSDTMVNSNKILTAICYSDGTTAGARVKVKELSTRMNTLTLGQVIDINSDSMHILQSLKDTKINELNNVKITLNMAIDLDAPGTSKILKSMQYKKVTENYCIELPTYTYVYEDSVGYVYDGTEKVFKFVDDGTGAKIFSLSANVTTDSFNYLVKEEKDSYDNSIYYLLTIKEDNSSYVSTKVETLIDEVGSEISKVPLSALCESSSNVILTALLKRGTTIDSLESDINSLTFSEVYSKESVWQNVEYGSIDNTKATYLYNETDGSFTLISTTSALGNYSVANSYNGNANLYQIKSDASTWLFILYNEDNINERNANGDADKYLADNASISDMDSTVNDMSSEIFSASYQQLYSVGLVTSAPASRTVAVKTFGEIMELINT